MKATPARPRRGRPASAPRPARAGAHVLDAAFAALADPSRRAVVQLLRRGPCRAGELAHAVGLRAPAMSRHLRVLRESGLIADDARGDDARVRTFRLQPEPFTALRGWLDEVETFWTAQLTAFKAHAERTRPRARAGAQRQDRR